MSLYRWADRLANLAAASRTVFDGETAIDMRGDPLAGRGSLTIAADLWIAEHRTQAIVSNWWRKGECGWGFGLTHDLGGRLEFRMYDESTGTNRGWISDLRYPLQRWCRVVVSVDGRTCRFYLDGQENERDTLQRPVTIKPNREHPVQVGHRVAAGRDEFFKGCMRQLSVWCGDTGTPTSPLPSDQDAHALTDVSEFLRGLDLLLPGDE